MDRAHRREQKSLDASEIWEEAPDSTERSDQEQARAALDEVLDALPADLRTVLVLHELEEMEMSEVAELLGIPAGTVASRLRRAREKFEVEVDRMRERLASWDDR